MSNFMWLAVCAVAVFASAALGSIFTSMGLGPWYEALSRPTWRPPDWLFGPVWTSLFILMVISSYIVATKGFERADVQLALLLFALQLILNVAWTGIFFGLRMPTLASVEIAILLVAIAAMIFTFWRVSPIAGILQIPYLVWVCFASALNIWIAKHN
ncbi:MAG: TspO/MBR family protein [Candidatus Brocadiia bacterium]